MRLYEIRAFYEPERVIGYKATTEESTQDGKMPLSHGMTYLEARQTYTELGIIMGLEILIEEESKGLNRSESKIEYGNTVVESR